MSRRFIHYGSNKFNKEMFCEISNNVYFTKPKGGLWASDVNAKYGWKDWCRESGCTECREDNSFTFTLREDARILRIDYNTDFSKLPKIKKYNSPFIDIKNMEKEIRMSETIYLDFEKLAEEYDVIDFYCEGLYWLFYGWDCSSVLIMNKDVIVEE